LEFRGFRVAQLAELQSVSIYTILVRGFIMIDRIIGALTFRKDVYSEVEQDTSFTGTAWVLVAVVAFLNNLGLAFVPDGGGILGLIGGTILAVVGFAVGSFVISWVGRALFKADVNFGEMVRTLGLAYIWNILGVLGILGAISPALGCLTAPVAIVAFILGLIAWFIAAKEALDLEWVQTIVTVLIGWVIMMVITGVIGGILGIGAFAAGAITG
jgi:hypothetical protein